MSTIIQDCKITKIINPHKSELDEYSLMITYRDIVYTTKITEKDFKSVLFEFDMLESLIYNSNHNQKVGDIDCSMDLVQKDNLERILEMSMKFIRDVKPMKKIEEEHVFVLREKKLDYDDKIGLAMMNLRNEINFVEIKPTTEIDIIEGCNSDYMCNKIKKFYIDTIKFKSLIQYHGGQATFKVHIILFIDKTKKPNNRKIKCYDNIDEFIKNREQFKTYHILDMHQSGYLLVEEMP